VVSPPPLRPTAFDNGRCLSLSDFFRTISHMRAFLLRFLGFLFFRTLYFLVEVIYPLTADFMGFLVSLPLVCFDFLGHGFPTTPLDCLLCLRASAFRHCTSHQPPHVLHRAPHTPCFLPPLRLMPYLSQGARPFPSGFWSFGSQPLLRFPFSSQPSVFGL